MNRKMRAKIANAEARAKRSRPRYETGNALFVTADDEPLFIAPILVDHKEKVIEMIPEKSEMN